MSDYLFSDSGAFMLRYFPRGQSLMEYALVLVLVSVAIIIMLALFGSGVGNMFSNIIANF